MWYKFSIPTGTKGISIGPWPLLLLFQDFRVVILASESILSESEEKPLRGGEELPKMLCLVALSLVNLHSQRSMICCPSLQRRHNLPPEDLGDKRTCVISSKAR